MPRSRPNPACPRRRSKPFAQTGIRSSPIRRSAWFISFARELANAHRVADATYAAVTEAFGTLGAVELAGMVGYYSMIAATLNAHEINPPAGQSDAVPGLGSAMLRSSRTCLAAAALAGCMALALSGCGGGAVAVRSNFSGAPAATTGGLRRRSTARADGPLQRKRECGARRSRHRDRRRSRAMDRDACSSKHSASRLHRRRRPSIAGDRSDAKEVRLSGPGDGADPASIPERQIHADAAAACRIEHVAPAYTSCIAMPCDSNRRDLRVCRASGLAAEQDSRPDRRCSPSRAVLARSRASRSPHSPLATSRESTAITPQRLIVARSISRRSSAFAPAALTC